MAGARRFAVVGGGWAGLSAAVRLTQQGHAVTVYEMAPQFGGRARRVGDGPEALDNGQHILIGAYRETLALMQEVGVDPAAVLQRLPLRLVHADGTGLQLRPGAVVPAFLRAVLGHRGWRWREKATLLATLTRWRVSGFRCPAGWTVARLTAALPLRIRDEFTDPLCVAALNTPAAQASASVFLRVLHDALLTGPGSADLLLPRRRLDALLPSPATAWLAARGATLRATQRVNTLSNLAGWQLDGEPFDGVVLACSASEAARLAAPLAPDWAAMAHALRYEPIVTVYLRTHGRRLREPMLALRADATSPAQYVFDLSVLGGPIDVCALVTSGAADWVARGTEAIEAAALDQARRELHLTDAVVLRTITEKRATFLCTPGLARPPIAIVSGLVAAGDYVAGPYPATLEGAVGNGRAAAAQLLAG